MRAEHEDEAYDDDPSDRPAHGYRSRQPACIPQPAAIRVATTTARCSLLARFAVALKTRLIQATYRQAPSADMPVADRDHASQDRRVWRSGGLARRGRVESGRPRARAQEHGKLATGATMEDETREFREGYAEIGDQRLH